MFYISKQIIVYFKPINYFFHIFNAEAEAPPNEEMKGEVQASTLECPYCHRTFRGSTIPAKHTRRCQEKEKLKEAKRRKSSAMMIMSGVKKKSKVETPPDPPQNLVVRQLSSSTMELVWKAPTNSSTSSTSNKNDSSTSSSSSNSILDYEVAFARRRVVKEGRKMTEEVEEQEPRSTSRWCQAKPVAHDGFLIEGLEGDTEYINIRVSFSVFWGGGHNFCFLSLCIHKYTHR